MSVKIVRHTHIHSYRAWSVGRPKGIVLLLLLGSLLTVASPAQTRPVEPPPPAEADFGTLADWIASNPGHTAAGDQLDRLIASAETMDELRRIAADVLPAITDSGVLARAASTLARITLVARDYATTSDLAETAYLASDGADLESLFLQSQALLQIGEIVAAEQRARMVVSRTDDYELKRRAYALVARAMHASGRQSEAARLLATLAELDDPALVEPDTLLLQSSVVSSLGESGDRPLDQLERLHPDSVAMQLVRGELVEQAPLPSALLTTLAAEAGTGGGEVTPPPEERTEPHAEPLPTRSEAPVPAVSAIQVGSFSDPENARHLSDDLRDLDLDVVVETVDRNGRSLELVLVTVPDETSASASRVLGVLREAGYDGFLIY
ncbi:MAG: SPOR domain-containing protein [Spirochaetota bacterium]